MLFHEFFADIFFYGSSLFDNEMSCDDYAQCTEGLALFHAMATRDDPDHLWKAICFAARKDPDTESRERFDSLWTCTAKAYPGLIGAPVRPAHYAERFMREFFQDDGEPGIECAHRVWRKWMGRAKNTAAAFCDEAMEYGFAKSSPSMVRAVDVRLREIADKPARGRVIRMAVNADHGNVYWLA